MSRTCTVCAHPEREAIDAGIVAGASYRNIAQQFRVGYTAVARHVAHISAALVEANEVETVAQADDLLADIRDLRADLKAARKDALEAGKFAPAALLANAEMRAFELLTKIYAELNARSSSDMLSDPQWREMREGLLAILARHPEVYDEVDAYLAGSGAAND